MLFRSSVSVRLAARRHNDTDLERIGEAHAACEEALESGDLEMYYQANERFHLAIYAASHNSFLYEETSNMQCRLAVYRRLQLRSHGRLKDSCNEHQGILDAIVAGDGENAASLAYAHVIVQGETFSDLIASLAAMRHY